MSIRKAKLDGKYVYADEGEKLRNMNVVCLNCGAKMHIRKFPERDDYYFALNPGEKHTSICQDYEGAKEAPVITGESPDQLIDIISTVSKSSGGRTSSGTGSGLKEPAGGGDYSPKKLTKISQIIKTGMYDEDPQALTFHDSNYRFIDFVIFDKWGRYIWIDSELVDIGARIIDARWIGSFGSAFNREQIIKHMKRTKEIWFKMFWKVGEDFRNVLFCFDCNACFSDIKTRKLFTSGINDVKGTYDDFVPRNEKLDVLIGARWAAMNKEQCRDKCPWKKCDGCLGAYWGRCNTAKQVELFPQEELTKNKEK